jgi:tellurite resistance-related uncharacterized protein
VPDEKQTADRARQRQSALSRWENDGGASPDALEIPELTNAELVQLRIRVIALENLVIALLAQGSDRELAVAREMAAYISPKPGFTHHPLTIQASAHMVELADRALHFRGLALSNPPPTPPFKSTPVYDQTTLPGGLRREHRTKPGVWGIIRLLEGRVRYHVLDPVSETILDPDHPGLVLPDQPHFVEPLGPIRMQIEFYDRIPDHKGSGAIGRQDIVYIEPS